MNVIGIAARAQPLDHRVVIFARAILAQFEFTAQRFDRDFHADDVREALRDFRGVGIEFVVSPFAASLICTKDSSKVINSSRASIMRTLP